MISRHFFIELSRLKIFPIASLEHGRVPILVLLSFESNAENSHKLGILRHSVLLCAQSLRRRWTVVIMPLPKQSQIFLQHLLATGPLSAKETAKLYNKCGQDASDHCNVRNPKSVNADGTGLEAVTGAINPKLELSGFAIRTIYSPWEKKSFWGVANILADDASRLAAGFTAQQLSYFFAMVEEMLESEGEMSFVDMQNFGPQYKLGVSVAGRTIQAFCKRGWLKIRPKTIERQRSPTKVVFGVQSMLELPNVRAFVLSGASTGADVASAGERAYESGESNDEEDEDDE